MIVDAHVFIGKILDIVFDVVFVDTGQRKDQIRTRFPDHELDVVVRLGRPALNDIPVLIQVIYRIVKVVLFILNIDLNDGRTAKLCALIIKAE